MIVYQFMYDSFSSNPVQLYLDLLSSCRENFPVMQPQYSNQCHQGLQLVQFHVPGFSQGLFYGEPSAPVGCITRSSSSILMTFCKASQSHLNCTSIMALYLSNPQTTDLLPLLLLYNCHGILPLPPPYRLCTRYLLTFFPPRGQQDISPMKPAY